MSRFIPRQLQDRKTLAMLGLQAAAITAFGPHGWITGPCVLGASLSYMGWLHYSKNKSIRHSVRQQYDPLQLPYIERTCEALPDMDGEGIIRLIQNTEMLTGSVLSGHCGSDLASVNWSRGGFTCWSPEQWLVHQANNPMRPEDWQSVWTLVGMCLNNDDRLQEHLDSTIAGWWFPYFQELINKSLYQKEYSEARIAQSKAWDSWHSFRQSIQATTDGQGYLKPGSEAQLRILSARHEELAQAVASGPHRPVEACVEVQVDFNL